MDTTFLAAPLTPYIAGALASILVAVLGFVSDPRIRVGTHLWRWALRQTPLRTMPTNRLRVLLGHLAVTPILGALAAAGAGGIIPPSAHTLAIGAGIGVYLMGGWVIPRRPIVAAQQRQRALRLLTPSFVATMRVELIGASSSGQALRNYVVFARPRLGAMQTVVRDAITLFEEGRERPFASLHAVAERTGCRELTDVALALKQAEANDDDVIAVLGAQETTLTTLLQDEFQRSADRKELILMLSVALTLVVGILGFLLYSITAGSPFIRGNVG